jgi:hypothetical protein
MVAQIVLAATILASRRPKIFSNPAKDFRRLVRLNP